MSRFLDALAARPLVLDAALGTRLLALGLDLNHDDPCLWCLDRPDEVRALHHLDRQAGAEVLMTNSFGAHRANLARLGRERDLEAVLNASVELAREAAGELGFVAGCLGPVPEREGSAYRLQAEILADLGVDLLVLETQEASSALAILESNALPRGCPLAVTLFRLPAPPFEPLRQLADLGLAALGVNCVPGVEAASKALAAFPRSVPLIAKPAATTPGARVDPPESFAEAVPGWLALGVRLMGGCCGTRHQHVSALRSALDAVLPLSSPPAGPL